LSGYTAGQAEKIFLPFLPPALLAAQKR